MIIRASIAVLAQMRCLTVAKPWLNGFALSPFLNYFYCNPINLLELSIMKFMHLTLVALISATLMGCGGGSKSNGNAVSFSPSITPSLISNPVSTSSTTISTAAANTPYTGKKEVATVSVSNQQNLVNALLVALADIANTHDVTAARPTLGTSVPFNLLSMSSNYKTLVDLIQSKIDLGNALENTLQNTSACFNGGSVQVTGSLDDVSKLGTLTATFDQCLESGVTTDNSASLTINNYDNTLQVVTDFTLTPTTLTKTIRNILYYLSGSIRFSQNLETGETTALSNLNRKGINNIQILDSNLRLISSDMGAYLSGQLCESNNGCVTISTPQAMQLINGNLSQGQLILTGFAGSKVRVRVLAGALWLDLDSNGNNIYEESRLYQ